MEYVLFCNINGVFFIKLNFLKHLKNKILEKGVLVQGSAS